MILSALNDLYRRMSQADSAEALPAYGLSMAKVVGAVHLDLKGQFLGLLDLRTTEGKKPRPRLLQVPQPPHRTAGIAAGFLCDNAGYLCGTDAKGNAKRAAKQFEAARELHHALLDAVDHPAARAILAYFDTWDVATAADKLSGNKELLSGWLVFQIHGLPDGESFAHDVRALRDAWERRPQTGAKVTGQCLVTGEVGPIARLHGSIKGVPGAQSQGASLVSFNVACATSYGKDQSFNAPVSEAVEFGYTTVLNHLLRDRRHSLTVGDTAVLFWAERASVAETVFSSVLNPNWGDWMQEAAEAGKDDQHRAKAQKLLDLLLAMRDGRPLTDPDLLQDQSVRFYVLGLAPNAARLSVRFWQVQTVQQMIAHLADHHHDMALEIDYPKRHLLPSLWSISQEVCAQDKDGKTRGKSPTESQKKLYGDLVRAVLSGTAYPASLPALLLTRFRSDGHITHPRIALLKAEFNRRRRLAGKEEECFTMSLDESRTDVGYRLGRLFAVLERIQEAAHGGPVNAGIGQKFLGAFSSTPRLAFAHLMKLKQAHMKKMSRDSKGLSVWYERLTGEIVDALGDIPASMGPDQQSQFFLGYYQQRQALFRSKDQTSAAADLDETSAA